MNFRLTIEADTLEEMLDVLRPRHSGGLVLPAYIDMPLKEVGYDEGDKPEVADALAAVDDYADALSAVKAEQEAAKKPRGRPRKTPATETVEKPTATVAEASPPATNLTLDNVKAAVSKLLDSGKATGAQVRDMLVNTFGVQSFGQLDPAQYPDVIGEVENLAV